MTLAQGEAEIGHEARDYRNEGANRVAAAPRPWRRDAPFDEASWRKHLGRASGSQGAWRPSARGARGPSAAVRGGTRSNSVVGRCSSSGQLTTTTDSWGATRPRSQLPSP